MRQMGEYSENCSTKYLWHLGTVRSMMVKSKMQQSSIINSHQNLFKFQLHSLVHPISVSTSWLLVLLSVDNIQSHNSRSMTLWTVLRKKFGTSKKRVLGLFFLMVWDYLLLLIFHGETTSARISLIWANAWFESFPRELIDHSICSLKSARSLLSRSIFVSIPSSRPSIPSSRPSIPSSRLLMPPRAESTWLSNSVFAIERCRKDKNIYTVYTYLMKTQKKKINLLAGIGEISMIDA